MVLFFYIPTKFDLVWSPISEKMGLILAGGSRNLGRENEITESWYYRQTAQLDN